MSISVHSWLKKKVPPNFRLVFELTKPNETGRHSDYEIAKTRDIPQVVSLLPSQCGSAATEGLPANHANEREYAEQGFLICALSGTALS